MNKYINVIRKIMCILREKMTVLESFSILLQLETRYPV